MSRSFNMTSMNTVYSTARASPPATETRAPLRLSLAQSAPRGPAYSSF